MLAAGVLLVELVLAAHLAAIVLAAGVLVDRRASRELGAVERRPVRRAR